MKSLVTLILSLVLFTTTAISQERKYWQKPEKHGVYSVYGVTLGTEKEPSNFCMATTRLTETVAIDVSVPLDDNSDDSFYMLIYGPGIAGTVVSKTDTAAIFKRASGEVGTMPVSSKNMSPEAIIIFPFGVNMLEAAFAKSHIVNLTNNDFKMSIFIGDENAKAFSKLSECVKNYRKKK